MFLKTVALAVAIASLGTTAMMGSANAATPTAAPAAVSKQAPKPARHATTHRTSHHMTKVAATHKATAKKG